MSWNLIIRIKFFMMHDLFCAESKLMRHSDRHLIGRLLGSYLQTYMNNLAKG